MPTGGQGGQESCMKQSVPRVLKSCCQFNICADGSTHGTKDILVSLMYSHAEDVGCVARIQHMPIGPLLPSEVHDISALATLAKKSKLSRFAAFRQLQAMSHQLSLLTNGAKTLSSFVRAKARRPIQSGEHRVVIPVFEFGANDEEVEDDQLRQCVSWAFICQDGGTQLPVLPEEPFWWEKVPILVACLDQESVGNAGMAFVLQNHMAHVKFDKIHRSIRGCARAMSSA